MSSERRMRYFGEQCQGENAMQANYSLWDGVSPSTRPGVAHAHATKINVDIII
jgi:hypothetical protein